MSMKRKAALVAATATLGLAGSAAAASAAFNITYSAGGAAVPVGTSFASSGGALQFLNATNNQAIANCTGSSLNGVTAGSGVSSQLNVTSGTYSGCVAAGQPVFVTVNASAGSPWQVVPTPGGTTSPFAGSVTGVNVTVRCGSAGATPATYSGNITTGATATNQTAGSKISLVQAGTLTKSGSGCPVLPASAKVTQENNLTSVGGSAVSPTNNLWLNP